MFYLYFSLFNKNIHEVKNIAIRIVSCHTYRDTYRIVKMCIVTSLITRDGSKSFFGSPSQVASHFPASPSQVTSHFPASPSQVTSHLVRRQVKSSQKSFGPNTSQVTSIFVQVQVKSHIILSSCRPNKQSGPGIKSIYSELQSKIYEMVNGIK